MFSVESESRLATGYWNTSLYEYGLGQDQVTALVFDPANRILVGTSDGLIVKDQNDRWTTYRSETSDLSNNHITSIAYDAEGNAWIGTATGVNRLSQNGEWTSYATSGLSISKTYVYALAVNHQGLVHCRRWRSASAHVCRVPFINQDSAACHSWRCLARAAAPKISAVAAIVSIQRC